MEKEELTHMIKKWILSAVHWMFGGIITLMGIFELLKMNFSTLVLYPWFELFIGVIIVVLGFVFAKNIIKLSDNSFSSL